MKMLIELWLDGYETEEQRKEACIEYVEEQLNMTASSIKVLWVEGDVRATIVTPGIKT